MGSKQPDGLTELLGFVRACRLCSAHLRSGPRPVLQAHAAARILIPGQAPGCNVSVSGAAFEVGCV